MLYKLKPSAKWLIAGLFLGNLAMFLFFLWDFLYLLGCLPWRLATFSKYEWLTVSVLFIAVGFVCYLLTNYFTYKDGTPLFPDQERWQRRSLVGGWGGISCYAALEVFLVYLQPEHFLTAQMELFPLLFSGSFLVSLFWSLRTIRRGKADADTRDPLP